MDVAKASSHVTDLDQLLTVCMCMYMYVYVYVCVCVCVCVCMCMCMCHRSRSAPHGLYIHPSPPAMDAYVHMRICAYVHLQVDIHLRRAATMTTWHANEHASVWSNLRGKDMMGEQDKWVRVRVRVRVRG